MKAKFNSISYEVIFTDHAVEQMRLRSITEAEVVQVIEQGTSKAKTAKGKFWVYMEMGKRKDNLICASISIESPKLIVITTLVNWSPK